MGSFYNYNHPFGDTEPENTSKRLTNKSSKETLALRTHRKKQSETYQSVQLKDH